MTASTTSCMIVCHVVFRTQHYAQQYVMLRNTSRKQGGQGKRPKESENFDLLYIHCTCLTNAQSNLHAKEAAEQKFEVKAKGMYTTAAFGMRCRSDTKLHMGVADALHD